MRCSSCDTPIPEGAAYCVECGATVAATGRTVALDTPRDPMGAPPELPVPTPAPALPPARRRRRSLFDGSWRPFARGLSARSGAIFLIGLGLLFFTGAFWPWILLLVGVIGALDELPGGLRQAATTLLFFGGLAVLFATGTLWPGILILLGLVALLDRVSA